MAIPYIGIFYVLIKKPFKKQGQIISAVYCVLMCVIVAIAGINSNKNPAMDTADNPRDNSVVAPESVPEIDYANADESAIGKLIIDKGGNIIGISSMETADGTLINVYIACEDDETTVNLITADVTDYVKSKDGSIAAVLNYAESAEDKILVMCSIMADGTVDTTVMDTSYNSAHNNWVKSQFSAWDGSCHTLTKMIKERLNDEKSYKHIETTYRIITDEKCAMR